MKRANNLIPLIADPDNLRLAFFKAARGKTGSGRVAAYRARLDAALMDLRSQILDGRVRVGHYHYFNIYDPKERLICAADFGEQVLHHALMIICHDRFEAAQIHDSYASRPGKGLHAALRRATAFNRPGTWFLKLDVRKFFASIHHSTLKAQLKKMFKEKQLLRIFDQIIDSYGADAGRGLPIGNLTSQYFANHYLSGLDHFIKEELKCRTYVRYMDDLVLWHEDKNRLRAAHRSVSHFVEKKLKVCLKPEVLNQARRGLTFCGYVVYPFHIRLSRRSKQRYIKRIRELDEKHKTGQWDEAACQRRAQALISFTRHADSVRFRKNVLKRLEGRTAC